MSNSKYQPLERQLKSLGFKEIQMTFEEIEAIIGTNLPPSARKHRPWWSNNPSNSVMTKFWLAAGYKTARVDIERECLVFVKEAMRGLHGASPPAQNNELGRHPVLGCMSGTVTVGKDVDLTAPTMPDWVNMISNQRLDHE